MNKIYYDKLNYTFFTDVMDNGLKVLYLKKPGFHKFSCYFGCNLGGKVNKYSYGGKIYDIPLGVAHFLEHQMFEMPDGVNASDYLSMYGLENNAYTSFDRTMYLVNGIENFDIAINYLLDFVQTPYFINKNIDVEREIIIQELNMYSDMPVVKIKNLVKKNLYGNISYSSDVGGSVEEVRKIDEDILNQVYNHFYTPKNMCVGIIGSYDEEYVFDLIRKNQAKKTFNYNDLPIVLLDKGLNNQIKHNDEIKLDINDDCVYYALKIKDELLSSEDYNSYTACMKLELLMEVLFGPSSPNYQYILDNDLAFTGFSPSICMDNDFITITFIAYSHKPKELVEYLNNIYKNINDLKIDEEYLKDLNKASLGSYIRDFNYFDSTISQTLELYMDGINSLDFYDYIVTKEDIMEIVKYIDLDSISYAYGFGKNSGFTK